MNIVVIGPGAIGALWAYHLHQAGHRVSVWSTKPNAYLALSLDDYPTIELENNQPRTLQQADLLLVTVKAWQVEQALLPIRREISSETMIAVMHNGMGTSDFLIKHFSTNPLLVATTTHGAYKLSDRQTCHTGKGHTQLGPLNSLGEQCQFLSPVLSHALPECSWNDNIQLALWQKLAINCAINPLTALHGIKNGDLASPSFTQTLTDVLSEVALVMHHQGFEVDANQLLDTVYQVIDKTAQNYSSMHQDIHHQRRSEIDYITGHLLKIAKLHRLETPVNQKLYNDIKHIETVGRNHD